jgi:hypothetical protein
LGTDPGKPSEETTCADAMEALSNRLGTAAGTAAAETANIRARFTLFITPPEMPCAQAGGKLTSGVPAPVFTKLQIIFKSCEYF